MSQQQREKTDAVTSAEPRTNWVRPELCRFEAGAAEAGDFTNADGNINS